MSRRLDSVRVTGAGCQLLHYLDLHPRSEHGIWELTQVNTAATSGAEEVVSRFEMNKQGLATCSRRSSTSCATDRGWGD